MRRRRRPASADRRIGARTKLLAVRLTLVGLLAVSMATACTGEPGVADTPLDSTTAAALTSTTSRDPSSDSEPLRLIAIGDSFVAWSDWPAMYARLASSHFGVPVEYDASLAGTGVPSRLEWIQASDTARETIGAADLIVVQPQPGWVAAPMFDSYLNEDCGGTTNTDCFTATAKTYRQYMDDYLDLITDLIGPETVIRVVLTGSWALEGFYPGLRTSDPDQFRGLTDGLRLLMEQAAGAAEQRGIAVLDVNSAFNGTDYQHATPDGYLVGDDIHLAELGSEQVAELLDSLGYEATG
jgi:hypothetical protein